MSPYTKDLLQLLADAHSVDAIAERHGVAANVVEADRAALGAALGTVLAQPRRPRRHTAALVAGLIVILCAGGAWAQLVTFVPDTPALASEMNANFQQLRAWLEQKVGTVGSAAITTSGAVNAGAVTAAGAVNAGSTVTSGNANVGGALTVTGVINANGGITGTGALNGVTIRVKGANNGTMNCDAYCASSGFGGFAGSCLGARLPSGQYTADCGYASGLLPPGQQLTCLCATY